MDGGASRASMISPTNVIGSADDQSSPLKMDLRCLSRGYEKCAGRGALFKNFAIGKIQHSGPRSAQAAGGRTIP